MKRKQLVLLKKIKSLKKNEIKLKMKQSVLLKKKEFKKNRKRMNNVKKLKLKIRLYLQKHWNVLEVKNLVNLKLKNQTQTRKSNH